MAAPVGGKTCVITGAGSGIAQAIADMFGARGAALVVSDNRLDAAQAAAEAITARVELRPRSHAT